MLTTAGATLTSDNVLATLRKRKEHQKQHNAQCVANKKKRQERAVAREIRKRDWEHQRQGRKMAHDDREEAELQQFRLRRASWMQLANETRYECRRNAREQALASCAMNR